MKEVKTMPYPKYFGSIQSVVDSSKALVWTHPMSFVYPSRTFQTGPKTTFHNSISEFGQIQNNFGPKDKALVCCIFGYAPKYFNFTYRSGYVLFLLVGICLDDTVSTKIKYTPHTFSVERFSENFDQEAVTYLSDLGDLKRGSANFFKNYIFEISAIQKMRYVTASWSKFSLNLSTEEVCSTGYLISKLTF